MENEVSYIFGKTLTKHLESLPTNERYLKNRIERFGQEFLQAESTFEDIDNILDHIYEYLYLCDESEEMNFTIMNLRQTIFWLREASEL